MESIKLFAKIKELGHMNSKRDELQELCRQKFDQITKFLPRRVLDSDGGILLDCIFNGLPDNPNSSCKQAGKLIDIVLQSMRKETTSLTHCADVTSKLCLELPRQPAEDLVRWSNDSIQSILQDTDVNMIWRDILPECLSALSSYSEVQHCSTTMSYDEYKQQCVHTLCQCKWTEKQLVQLVAMFKDMQLTRNDHKQVVNKICSYIIDIPPDVLPPLVHQLLKLCKLWHVDVVLAHLSHYFSVRLYSKLEPPPQDSESTTMDIDDITPHSAEEISRCLSTCLYHITEGAAEPEMIRKHLKAWPKTQLLRAPFIVDLALALSDKGSDFRSVCLDVIKSAIEQRTMDDLRCKESAWVRSVLPPDIDVASVLKVLTTESANHRQLTVVGLINLAYALLSVSRVKPVAQTCWSHGKLVLVRLSKAQPETAPHILGQLADRLAGDNTQRQFADCLYVLCKLTPVSVERCSQLSSILESCQPSPTDCRAPAAVLDAVHPLINFSTRTRDTLVMVCRKGLYSRDSLHRCLALSGFLTVLRHIKLSTSLSSSQSVCSEQFSSHSYLTQVCVELHATQQGSAVTSRVRNEAMCMEVVSILRRCLVQDATVKHLLYTKLYECARDKSALHEAVLELLYEHLSKYLPESDSDFPLLLDKCVHISTTTAVLTEPISNLLYAVAQFLQITEDEDLEDILSSQNGDTGCVYLKNKLTFVMDQLCKSDRLGVISMEDPSLSDLTPESKAKCLKVQQILQCYEALVAHRVMQWTHNSDDAADSVYNLFKSCNQLLEQTKTPSKANKKCNKTLNETKDTNKSQKSQKSQQEKGKPSVKMSAGRGSASFRTLTCLWDPDFCLRLMELLYSEEVSWSSVEQRNKLRGRRDFHHWALKGVQSAAVTDKKTTAKYLPRIARILYTRCVCRFQEMCEFDEQTTLSCLELFKTCLAQLFLPTFALKPESFLTIITGIADGTLSSGIVAILDQLHSAMVQLELDADAEDREQMSKKLLATIIQIAVLLLEVPTVGCPKMTELTVKLEDYIRTSKQDCLALIPAVLGAAGRDQHEAQLLDDLLAKLAFSLGNIDEEDSTEISDSGNFPSIDARTGHVVLNHICQHLNARFKCIEHLLARAKDLSTALNNAVHGNQQRIEREMSELYKSLMIQLCQVTSWSRGVAKLRCSVGGGSDRVLALVARLYGCLQGLVSRLPNNIARQDRLERLLKLAGKKLSAVTDTLITYLEASQQQQQASKVLRDTKLIPRVVLEAEHFSKNVILLANRAQLNLQHYLSLGTARDFKIKAPILQEALQARQHQPDDLETSKDEDDEQDIHDAETDVVKMQSSEEEEESKDLESSRKKRKRIS